MNRLFKNFCDRCISRLLLQSINCIIELIAQPYSTLLMKTFGKLFTYVQLRCDLAGRFNCINEMSLPTQL